MIEKYGVELDFSDVCPSNVIGWDSSSKKVSKPISDLVLTDQRAA